MSTITPRAFPRSMFDWNLWNMPLTTTVPSAGGLDLLGPSQMSTLDIFDPFDELDRMMSRNLQWITQPDFLKALVPEGPRFPEKHRITIDCSGFDPNSIRTDINENKLVVTGKEGDKSETEDFVLREFRKTYELPSDLDREKMLSFVTQDGQLVIEFPIKREEKWHTDLLPRVLDAEQGGKKVELNVKIPDNIDPSKIVVTCKDRDLIVKADYKDRSGDKVSRVHYYRRCTMPESTDFDQLKCVFDQGKLCVTAPLSQEMRHRKRVPVEIKGGAEEEKGVKDKATQEEKIQHVCETCGLSPQQAEQVVKSQQQQPEQQQQQSSGGGFEQQQQQQPQEQQEQQQQSDQPPSDFSGTISPDLTQPQQQPSDESQPQQQDISQAKTGDEQEQQLLSGEGGGEEAALPSQLESERSGEKAQSTSAEQQKGTVADTPAVQSLAEGGKRPERESEQTR